MKTPKKVYVLGPVGSGKSLWANRISEKLKIPHYDMDDVRFVKKFSKVRTKPQRKILINKILKKKQWVIDARGTTEDRHAMLDANIVLWMQTPFYKSVFRIFKRYFKRIRNPEFDEKLLKQFALVRCSWGYRFERKETSFKPLKEFMKENKINPISIKNKRQIRKFIDGLKG